MVATIPEIPFPELFFGIVAPIGGDVKACVRDLSSALKSLEYEVIEIKVTDVFDTISKFVAPLKPLVSSPVFARYDSYIEYGNQLRSTFIDDAFLAALAIGRVTQRRISTKKSDSADLYSKKPT